MCEKIFTNNQNIRSCIANIFVMVCIIAVYDKNTTRRNFFRVVIYHTPHTAFIDNQHLQTLMHVQPRKAVADGIHVWEFLKVNIVGRVRALFV